MHPEPRVSWEERRYEPRTAVQGRVVVNLTEPMEQEFAGDLLDVSGNGFRAAHACRELHSGQIVRFHHDSASGQARVVWTRIEDQRVESGFFILTAE